MRNYNNHKFFDEKKTASNAPEFESKKDWIVWHNQWKEDYKKISVDIRNDKKSLKKVLSENSIIWRLVWELQSGLIDKRQNARLMIDELVWIRRRFSQSTSS